MTTIVTRTGKGSPLTHVEVDTNFTNLNTAKLEAGAIALGSAGTPSISFTGDTDTGIYSPGANQVAISTNGTGRLFVDASGNVSLNRAAPATLGANYTTFTIRGKDNDFGGGIIFESLDASDSTFLYGDSGAFYVVTQDARSIIFGTNAIEKVRLTSGGLLGLGTSSPGAQLQLNTASAATVGQIIVLAAGQTADVLKIVRNDGNNSLQFTPSGQLSFGDLSPSPTTVITLGPSTSTNANLKITSSNVGNPNLLLQSMAGAGGGNPGASFVYFGDNNRALSYVGSTRTNAFSSNASGDLVFGTTPDISTTAVTQRMCIDSSGRLLVGTGTANTSGAKLQTVDGITFPATAVASADVNTLDDYEEGTWTPNQGSGLTVVGTFSSIGRYTKIGNMVTVWGQITSTTSIAVAAIGIITTNIPFTLQTDIGATGTATGFWSASNSVIRISTGATTSIHSVQSISGVTDIGFTITYRS